MIDHGNMLGFDSAFCTHPKSGRHISKYPAPGGYKGQDPQRWKRNATCFPPNVHDEDSAQLDGTRREEKSHGVLWGVVAVGSNVFDMHAPILSSDL